jgi:hypothetical protein
MLYFQEDVQMYYWNESVELKVLVGKKITDIKGLEKESDEVSFFTDGGDEYKFHHLQTSRERVVLNDFDGSAEDLIGATVLSAEEVEGECEAPEHADSYTWAFYKIETDKGGLWMRWIGESNGYYSEGVAFILVKKLNAWVTLG